LVEDTPTSVTQHFAFSSGDRAAIVDAIRFFFTKSFPFLFLYPSLVGLLLLFKDRTRYFFFIALALAILLVFHGRAYGGFEAGGRVSLQSSFLRYMIPVYALLPIGLACLLKEIAEKITRFKYIAVLLGTIMILMISFTVTYSDYGLDMLEELRNDRIDIGHKIDSVVAPESIIITDLVALPACAMHHENIIFYPDIPEEIRIDEITRVLRMVLVEHRVFFIGSMYVGSDTTQQNTELLNHLGEEFAITKSDEIRHIEIHEINLAAMNST